jgi:hypothetical protein
MNPLAGIAALREKATGNLVNDWFPILMGRCPAERCWQIWLLFESPSRCPHCGYARDFGVELWAHNPGRPPETGPTSS